MDDIHWQRRTGWTGIVVTMLLTVSAMLGSGMRQYDASAATTVHYFVHHGGQVAAALDLQLINVPAFLLFLVGLRTVLKRIDAAPAVLSTWAFAAGLVLVPVLLMWHAMPAAVALASQAGDVGSVRTLLRLGAVLDTFATLATGMFVATAAAVMIRSRYLPRWLGWFGLLVGVLCMAGSLDVLHPEGAVSGVGHVGFLGFVVWVLGASISLLRVSQTPQTLQNQSPADTAQVV